MNPIRQRSPNRRALPGCCAVMPAPAGMNRDTPARWRACLLPPPVVAVRPRLVGVLSRRRGLPLARNPRCPRATCAVAASRRFPPWAAVANDARALPLEAQVALIEIERERTKDAVSAGKMPPLPPITLPK